MGILRSRGYLVEADTTAPAWVDAQAASSAENDSPYEIPEVDDDFTLGDLNPFGIVKNIGEGVVNLGKGLGSLAMMGLGDVRSLAVDAAQEVLPGAMDTEQQYFTPSVAKSLIFDPERSDRPGLGGVWEDALGGIKEDWTRRYAEPLEKEGLSGLVSSVLSDPLPVAFDVLGAATVAGKGASIGARATYNAHKLAGTNVIDELAEIGQLEKAKALAQAKSQVGEAARLKAEIADLTEQLSPPAAFIKKIHPGRGLPNVTLGIDSKGKAISQKVRPGGVRTVLGAPSGKVPVGFRAESANPVTRGLSRFIDKRLLSGSMSKHLDAIGRSQDEMLDIVEGAKPGVGTRPFVVPEGAPPGQEKVARVIRENQAVRVKGRDLSEKERLVARAMQYDLERIPHAPVLKHRAKKTFDQIAGRYTTAFYGARDEYTQAFVDLLEEYGRRGVPIDTAVLWAQSDTVGRKGVALADGTNATVNFQDLVDTVATQVGKDPEFDPTILRGLGDEAIARATAAMPDGFTFNADKMRLTVSNWNEAPGLIDRLATGFGGTAEILSTPNPQGGNFSGVVARINTPNGSFKVQALTPESSSVADTIDDWAQPMGTWRAELADVERELRRAEGEIAGLQAMPDEPGRAVSIQRAFREKAAAAKRKKELELELKASQALIEDHGELHMYQLMRNSGLDGGGKDVEFEAAEMIARLRVLRHQMTVGPARARGKFKSASAIMERAYLPLKLELFAARSGKLQPLLDDVIEAMDSGDKAKLTEHIETLKSLGFDGSPYREQMEQVGGMTRNQAILQQAIDAIRGGNSEVFGTRFEQLARLVKEGGDTAEINNLSQFFRSLGYEATDAKSLVDEILADAIHNPRATDDFVLGDLEAIGNVTMWEYFHDIYRAAGKQTPIYIPHIDGRRTKPSDFLMQKYNAAWESKATKGWDKRVLGHVYKNGQYVTDVGEAWSRRAAQVRKYMDIMDMHDELVETFGRPVSFLDEISDGEALMAPKITEHYFRARAQAEEEMIRLLEKGVDEGAALHEGTIAAINKLQNVPRTHMPIEDYIRSIDPDGNLARLTDEGEPLFYAVPKLVAQRLDDMAKFHLGWKARIFWDGPLNVWRGAVLAFSPRWLIYNLLGNTMFVTMQGASAVKAFKLMGQKAGRNVARRLGVDDWTPEFLRRVESAIADLGEDTQRAITGGFFSSTEQGIRHLGVAEDTAWGQLIKGLRAEAPVKKGAQFAAKMRKLNETIEESFRQTSFIKAMDRQLTEEGGGKFLDVMDKARVKAVGEQFLRSEERLARMAKHGVPDEAAIGSAVEEVNRFLNDYMTLSPMERNVIKRYVMPFYSFYKHQFKLIASYAPLSPMGGQALRQLGLVSQELAQDFGNMPDWMLGMMPVGWGRDGERRFYNTRSANPFTSLQEGPQGFLSGLAPQVRGVAEWATGKDIVTGKPLSSPDVITPFGSRTGYTQDPQTGEMVPGVAHVSPLETALSQFPQFELGRDIATGLANVAGGGGFETGARYSTGEVMTDPYGNPVFPGSVWQKIGQYLGYSTSDFDQENYVTREAEMERAALIGLLRREGVLPMPVADE